MMVDGEERKEGKEDYNKTIITNDESDWIKI